jgi:hypothetical protein
VLAQRGPGRRANWKFHELKKKKEKKKNIKKSKRKKVKKENK